MYKGRDVQRLACLKGQGFAGLGYSRVWEFKG